MFWSKENGRRHYLADICNSTEHRQGIGCVLPEVRRRTVEEGDKTHSGEVRPNTTCCGSSVLQAQELRWAGFSCEVPEINIIEGAGLFDDSSMPRLQRWHPVIDNSTVVSFPVVFFNGEHKIDLSNINVHPPMEFKKFQSFLSQKIGISPNQISVSLIRRKPSKSPPGNLSGDASSKHIMPNTVDHHTEKAPPSEKIFLRRDAGLVSSSLYPEYEDRYGYEGVRERVPKSNGVVVCEVCSDAKEMSYSP
uniref:DUF7138 domain-containing protein n=1 Tax=Nelumbo nucifera TaxID=4432 RepID=A0A822ZLZ0_NELNU|nr:TPA_asm: hypothetical protein HUJ06_004137 [Nelumbo nucifera]